MRTVCGQGAIEVCDYSVDTASEPNTAGPLHSIDSSPSSLVTGIFLFEDGPMTLGPSADVRVSPAWPLARAPRGDFLFWSLNLVLNCEHVLRCRERMSRLVVPYFMLISFASMSSAFPRPILTELIPPGPPALDRLRDP